jgi:hypothetical protein
MGLHSWPSCLPQNPQHDAFGIRTSQTEDEILAAFDRLVENCRTFQVEFELVLDLSTVPRTLWRQEDISMAWYRGELSSIVSDPTELPRPPLTVIAWAKCTFSRCSTSGPVIHEVRARLADDAGERRLIPHGD